MSKYSVGEEYWQIGKECYAKYIKEDDDRIGGLIVTYRGDLNTYGIDCGLLIDSAHTMLTNLGFEITGDSAICLNYYNALTNEYVLYDSETKLMRIDIHRATIAHTNALTQLLKEQGKEVER